MLFALMTPFLGFCLHVSAFCKLFVCRCRNLAGKGLKGSLPQGASDYSSLSTLTLLDLSNNQLTGSLPPLGSLTALQTLELMQNSFSGPLPDLAGFNSLTAANFQENQFSGEGCFKVCWQTF